jgi:hypothetical protein
MERWRDEAAAYFAGSPLGAQVLDAVLAAVAEVDGVSVRVGRSQIALHRRRGFAWVWLPGRHLGRPTSTAVVSVALGRKDASARWKEVVQPRPGQWMHHLEVADAGEIDDQVRSWLLEAAARAG